MLDTRDAVSPAVLARRDDVIGFTLGGLSKSIGLPQVKLGWIVVSGPHSIVGRVLPRLELVCDTYLSASTPVQLAAAELLNRGAMIRDQIIARVQFNYARCMSLVADVPSCRLLHADAGWSAVIQVPTLTSEEELALALLRESHVLAHPGYFFDFPRESFVIASLLPPADVFEDGVSRLLARFSARELTR
jgi:aspartate/methionine/tyrosine aminotransferase